MRPVSHSETRKTILLRMTLVPLVTLILILGIGYYYFASSIENSTVTRMQRIVEDHRRMIDSFLEERRADLEFILHSHSYFQLTDPETLHTVFTNLQRKSSAFVDLGIFNEEGIHVAYQGPYRLAGKDYGQEAWFKQVLKEWSYISDIFLGFRRIPHFVVAVARPEEGYRWVIRATIDIHVFNEIVKSVRIGKTGEGYIINAEGLFQTERRSGGSLMEREPDDLPFPAPGSGLNTFIEKDARGDAFLYATTWLKNKEWLLVVRQEKADAFSALRKASYLIVLITILGGASIVVLSFYLTDRIVRRMEKMKAKSENLSGQLIRASRLAELGEMAAGFAHEINNPLQIMKNEQSLMAVLLEELKASNALRPSESLSELEDSMAQVGRQIDRCANITQAILRFGRQGEPSLESIDLRQFIPDVSKMISKKASVNGIALHEELASDTPWVRADPGQLQQVLLNLLNNAMDAIEASHGARGGELGISARGSDDGKAEIRVSDNGCGISKEHQGKVFSPFFTTKPAGKGTGLGLSVCYGIIDGMGGTLEFESEKGVGTTFIIRIPAEDR